MIRLTSSKAWKALVNHQKEISKISLAELFKDKNRFNNFSIEEDDFLLDYSKNIISSDTMNLLFHLLKEVNVIDKIEDMFNGKKINLTEDRAVLHTALRNKSGKSIFIDNENITTKIEESLHKMEQFSNEIRMGVKKGFTGKNIEDVVNIGIGGSDLGPKMITESLLHYADGPRVHFTSNVDASDIAETLKKLNPETTLFLIASKTFTTDETTTNAKTAKHWILQEFGIEAIPDHFAALSTNFSLVKSFGINKKNIFPFWDFVGGRFSSWSSIGLSICISIGFKNFNKFLQGGYKMDCHFRQSAPENNFPIVMALLGIWYNNFFRYETHAILPYDYYLSYLTKHIQQVDMESNGKSVTLNGDNIDYQTGPIIWGEPGTNGQHAFFQLIHQGTKIIPCDFIGFKKSLNPIKDHHDKLMANYFAQTKALAFGLTKNEVEKQLSGMDLSKQNKLKLLPHKIFQGNRPTNSLLINKLTPESIGKLLALYEHKVFIQSLIWDVNCFDQWGVELGKNLAKNILTDIKNNNITKTDISTASLLKKYLNNNEKN